MKDREDSKFWEVSITKFLANGLIYRGFTYIEVLIAVVIFGMIAVPVWTLLSSSLANLPVSQEEMKAANITRLELEKLSNVHFIYLTSQSRISNYAESGLDLERQVTEEQNQLRKTIVIDVYRSGTNQKVIELRTYRFGGLGLVPKDSYYQGRSVYMKIKNVEEKDVTVNSLVAWWTTPTHRLRRIRLDGGIIWAGDAPSGTLITLDREAFLPYKSLRTFTLEFNRAIDANSQVRVRFYFPYPTYFQEVAM